MTPHTSARFCPASCTGKTMMMIMANYYSHQPRSSVPSLPSSLQCACDSPLAQSDGVSRGPCPSCSPRAHLLLCPHLPPRGTHQRHTPRGEVVINHPLSTPVDVSIMVSSSFPPPLPSLYPPSLLFPLPSLCPPSLLPFPLSTLLPSSPSLSLPSFPPLSPSLSLPSHTPSSSSSSSSFPRYYLVCKRLRMIWSRQH